MAEGFSIRIVDLNGRPLEELVSDQTFRIELYVPKDWDDPGNVVEVEFTTSEGTADLDITWTDETDSEWKFTSTPLTVAGGGEGGGDVSIAGFTWSTGDLGRGEIDYEDGTSLSVQFEHPDGNVAEDSVTIYETPVSMGHAQAADYIAKADEVYNKTLANITAAREELDQYPDSGEKDEITAALDALEADILQRLSYVTAANGSLNRSGWTRRAQLAVALGYLSYLQQPPELLGAIPWTDALALERANKEKSDAAVTQMVLRGIGQATIGAYRLFAATTLVAQLRTLFFGVNEMGQQVGGDERVLALLDLITEAALTGAGMKFQLDHLAAPTRQRVVVPPPEARDPLVPRRGVGAYQTYGPRSRSADPSSAANAGTPVRGSGSGGASRFQGDNLADAETGDLLTPGQAGMMREATIDAQRIAREPRDGYENGTLIWTRPSNIAGLHWRRQGHPPKGTEIKSKTINDIDVLLGAEPGTQGLVGFFEPVLPPRAAFDPAFFAKIEGRFDQRMNEFNGGIGDHMRQLEADGQIRFDDGVVVDTGLYGNTGKGITGDYDLFEITDLDGNPVSTPVYDAVVADLMNSEAFQALHGAHMRWLDLDDFRKPSKLADNLNIFTNVIGKHQRGGEEPLFVIGGDRPPFAVWAEDLPTRHLADLPENVHQSFSRNVSQDGILISGISPLFMDRDAAADWEEQWDVVVAQTHAVLGRTTLADDADGEALPLDPDTEEAWAEWRRQAEAAFRNPSVLDYLDESPFAAPPDDWVPGQPYEPRSPVEPIEENEPSEESEPDPEWEAFVARQRARLGPSILDHDTGIDETSGTGFDDEPPPPEDQDTTEEPDPAWAAEVARANARLDGPSVLDHETGIDEESGIDPGAPAPVAPAESVLNYLEGEPDLGPTPVPPGRSVLDYLEEEPERPPSSPLEAIERDLAAPVTDGAQNGRRRRVPLWAWPAAIVAVIAIGAFLAFSGGDDSEATASGGGEASAATSTPASQATPAGDDSGAPTSTVGPTTAPTTGATMTPAQIPSVIICPDGSTFSGFEQQDGSYIDATTGETRVCPSAN